MSSKIICTCDRCGASSDESGYVHRFNARSYSVDLCHECMEYMERVIENGLNMDYKTVDKKEAKCEFHNEQEETCECPVTNVLSCDIQEYSDCRYYTPKEGQS
ncbi:MAG: hypothetical protein Ta2B_14480 [Termitinemataceae bacterium]|nr:MAG: hypothetical protein Ta2B_14480 [Termitinemataceae bacterium]